MARLHLNLVITEFDHPKLGVDPPEADDDRPWVSIRTDEVVTINGSLEDVRRWVQELAMQVAQAEA